MERKFLDLISTKYTNEKLKAELEIEKIVSKNILDNKEDIDFLSVDLMKKINKLREINADLQMWESIVSHLLSVESPENEG